MPAWNVEAWVWAAEETVGGDNIWVVAGEVFRKAEVRNTEDSLSPIRRKRIS